MKNTNLLPDSLHKNAKAAMKHLSEFIPRDSFRHTFRTAHEKAKSLGQNHGQQLGARNQPPTEQIDTCVMEINISDKYQSLLIECAENDAPMMEKAMTAYIHLDDRLANEHRERQEREGELERVRNNKVTDITEKYEMKQAVESRLLEEQEEILADCIDKLAEAEEVEERKYTNGWRMFLKHGWLLWTILTTLGLLEVGIYNAVFSGLQFDRIETYLITLVPVAGLVFLSHFTGKSFKRWSENRFTKIKAIVCALLCILFILAVNYYRFEVFHAEEAAESGEEMSPFAQAEFWTTVLINLVVYAVGIGLAFATHDTSNQFEDAFVDRNYTRYPKAQKTIDAIKRRIERLESLKLDEIALANQVYEKERALLNQLFEDIKAFRSECAAAYNGILEHMRNWEKDIEAKYEECITEFRRENLMARSTPPPSYFTMPVTPLKFQYAHLPKLNC